MPPGDADDRWAGRSTNARASTTVNDVAMERPLSWFRSFVIATVPFNYQVAADARSTRASCSSPGSS